MNSPQKQQVQKLLKDFDHQMDDLRRRFHVVLQKYEASRVENLKKIISQIKSS